VYGCAGGVALVVLQLATRFGVEVLQQAVAKTWLIHLKLPL